MASSGPGRVLITGGAGFVGRPLTRVLLEDAWDVVVLDNLHPLVHGPDASPPSSVEGVRFIHADLRDQDAVAEAIEGVDVVVHLAAETAVGRSMHDVRYHVDVNATGTANLLEAILRATDRPRRLVLSSSRAVYGEGSYDCPTCGTVTPSGRRLSHLEAGRWEPRCPTCAGACRSQPTPETARLVPVSVYGATKLMQEQLVQVVLPAVDVETVVLRYFNVYGPGQSLSNPYVGILSTFLERARAGHPIEVYEDGEESRDFVYIDDVVAATAWAVNSRPRVRLNALNIGTGQATSLVALARRVVDLTGSSSTVDVSGAFRVGDIRHATADVRQAEAMGLRSAVDLTTGLSRWLDWAWPLAAGLSDRASRARSELAAHGVYRRAR